MQIKNTLKNLFALSIGIVLSIFLGECLVRFAWFGTNGFSYKQLNSFKNIGVSGFLEPASNHKIFYQLKPNLDTLFKFKKFSTNRLNMRDKEFTFLKASNTFRIAIIGDSFAMGSGVGQEEMYAKVLEKMLNNQESELDFEVLNFGVGGYNLLNYQGILEEKVPQFDPDLVIIGFCGGNDFNLPDPAQLEGHYKIKPSREVFKKSYLRKIIMDALKPERPSVRTTPNIEEIQFVDRSFNHLKSLTIQQNARLVICYYSLEAADEDVMLIKEIANEQKIPFIDVSKSLRNQKVSSYYVHKKFDWHPNDKAHSIFAKELFNFLKDEDLMFR